MSKRFRWLLGLGVLVLIGLLVACSSTFNSSSDGLVVVGSQGSGLLETFSFNLSSGHNSAISNPPSDTANQVCVLNGLPSAIVIDPAGAFAYSIINANSTCPGSATGIQAFKINSDGTIATTGKPLVLANTVATVTGTVNECGNQVSASASATTQVAPGAMAFDSAGKYLFISDANTSGSGTVTYTCNNQQQTATVSGLVPGTISVLSVGAGGTLTEVPGSPFAVPVTQQAPQVANLVALAVTPTVFPGIGVNGVGGAVCSVPGNIAPTLEYLYVADQVNDVVWQFDINQSTGALTAPPNQHSFPTGANPSGVAVDPCDRFVYVSDMTSNQISAFTICNGQPTQSTLCPSTPDDSLEPIAGSPISLSSGNGPGPILVDPFGNFVYTLDTLSSQITILKMSQVSGGLTFSAVAQTGLEPVSMTIRADDNWMFVTNSQAATLSQYSITPASGALTPSLAIGTDNLPSGVAVK